MQKIKEIIAKPLHFNQPTDEFNIAMDGLRDKMTFIGMDSLVGKKSLIGLEV